MGSNLIFEHRATGVAREVEPRFPRALLPPCYHLRRPWEVRCCARGRRFS